MSVCQKLQASSLLSALAKQTALISVFNLIIISVFNLQCRELTENPFLLKKRNLCSQANRARTRNKIVPKLVHSAPQEAAVCTIVPKLVHSAPQEAAVCTIVPKLVHSAPQEAAVCTIVPKLVHSAPQEAAVCTIYGRF